MIMIFDEINFCARLLSPKNTNTKIWHKDDNSWGTQGPPGPGCCRWRRMSDQVGLRGRLIPGCYHTLLRLIPGWGGGRLEKLHSLHTAQCIPAMLRNLARALHKYKYKHKNTNTNTWPAHWPPMHPWTAPEASQCLPPQPICARHHLTCNPLCTLWTWCTPIMCLGRWGWEITDATGQTLS